MGQAFELKINNDKIGLLYFDLQGQTINLFNAQVLTELGTLLDQLKNKSLKALVIFSRKKNIFIAGADIKEFLKIKTFKEGVKASRQGQLVFEKLHRLSFPTIAVINGACMGGGTEMCLACTYRLAVDHPKTKIALPEVKFGILPGWGGTQRLPEIVGLQNALDIILTGKNLTAQKAFRLGLVDLTLKADKVEEKALHFARQVVAGNPHLKQTGIKKSHPFFWLLEKNSLGRKIIFKIARKNILKKTHGNYPAPLKALKIIKATYSLPVEEGLKEEANALAELILTKESKNLVTLFLWQDELKKKAAQMVAKVHAKKFNEIHLMANDGYSTDLVQLLSAKGYSVNVLSEDPIILQNLEQTIQDSLEKQSSDKKLFARITFSSSAKINEIPQLVLIDNPNLTTDEIEWLTKEKLKNVLVMARALRAQDVIEKLKQNDNWTAIHFYHLLNRSQIAEIGFGPKEESNHLAVLFQFVQSLGKIPIRLYSKTEFLFSNLLIPYLMESLKLAIEGFSIKKIEETALRFGMVSPPFLLMDAMGIETVVRLANASNNDAAYEKEMKILRKMIYVGWKGTKDGRGFYQYSNKKRKANAGIRILLPEKFSTNNDHSVIEERLVGILFNGAAHALNRKLVKLPMELDAVSVFGLGFAPFRGGILRYADALGINNVLELLQALNDKYGIRFSPHSLWPQMVAAGQTFYHQV